MQKSFRTTAEGSAWALLAVTLWSGWFVATRVAVGPGGTLAATDLVALRFGIGGLLLLPVLVAHARALPRAAWIDGLWLTAGSGAPFALIVSAGLRFAPAGHAAALAPGTMPLFAAAIGIAALRDRPSRLQLVGLALIASGALTLAGGLADRETLVGHSLFLVASLLWAIGTVRLRRSGLSPLDATALVCVYSLVAYLPPYLLAGGSRLALASWRELAFQGVYQGVLASAVALLAFNRAVVLLGRRAPGFSALVPVLATVLAIPVLGELPGLLDSAAIVMVGSGVFLTAIGGGSVRAPSPGHPGEPRHSGPPGG